MIRIVVDNMLKFTGPAFSNSPILRSAYAPFYSEKGDACVYFSLQCSDVTETEKMVVETGMVRSVGTTSFLFLADTSICVIRCYNYRCLATENFSVVSIHAPCIRNLTKASFVHLNENLYQLARFRALYLDMLILHASAIVYRGEVIMFSGSKGAGKSTQARLWIENQPAWVLNYDKPVVKLDADRVMVSGSPWGGKEDLAINMVHPAKAIFFVHQAKENRAERLPFAKAYAQAHLNYLVYPLNEDIENRYNDAIVQLVMKVPIYNLYCTDTVEAVEVVQRELYTEEE